MKLAKTYDEVRAKVRETEGTAYPGKALVEMELEPGYERTKTRLLSSIKIMNEAHLLMLMEQEIVSRKDAKIIMQALQDIDYEAYRNSDYDGHFEDLYFKMEDELVRNTDGVAGNLHLARSRNDMCVAWSHMAIRGELLEVMEALIQLQNTVLLFAEEHKDTLYVVHTHTQHAQPGYLGHYFLGMADVIGRDLERIRHAYQMVNSSPMGAAAITTTGFPISRQRVAELAGFDTVIENAYDAIGNCDYFTETAHVSGLCALNLGRCVTDMVLWATEELKMIRVADGYISTSSIMPQKRNPIALEHLRSSLSVVKGLADTVITGFLKTPYGDISDYEDIEDTMSECLDRLIQNLHLYNAVLATLDVDKELLKKRAFESFSVVTEIADQMYRSYHIPFRQAHSFVSGLVKKADRQRFNLKNITEEFFAETYEEFFGMEFTEDFDPILKSIDPYHFVECREVLGGTGKRAMEDMLRSSREKVKRNAEWYADTMARLDASEKKRMDAVQAILKTESME